MRTYQKTHPWLKFAVDMTRASSRLWMALGEANSKCEHIADTPLLPVVRERLHKVYLAKGVYATSAIEGNTLTEEQVGLQVEGKLQVPPSQEYLRQEIESVLQACNEIPKGHFSGRPTPLSVERIKDFNRRILHALENEFHVVPGELRTVSVVAGQYRAAPAEDVEHLLEKLCDWLNGGDFQPPSEAERIPYGILKALIAHVYLAWIHPFGDGNGRMARLVEFDILIASGIPLPAALLLCSHYNSTRQEYYRQLDRTSKSGGDLLPFVEYAVRGFVEGLREQLQWIKAQQINIAWRDFVRETFEIRRQNSAASRRREAVAQALPMMKAIPLTEVRHLNPRIAESYAGKTAKTLSRDMHELEKMALVERSPEGYTRNVGRILAFRPKRT